MTGKQEVLADVEWSADPLDRLRQLRQAGEELEQLTAIAVAACRSSPKAEGVDDVEGVTRLMDVVRPVPWRRIAELLGISEEAARRRWR